MNTEQTALLMEAEDGASLWHDAWLRLRKNRAAVTGGGVLVIMVVLAILTPWIAPYAYEAQNLDLGATPPSCLLYTSPSPRDRSLSRMPSSA